MDEIWRYVIVYATLMTALVIEVAIAVNWRTLGTLSAAGVLIIASLQAVFGFLYYMHGKYGSRSITLMMILSLAVIIPLFIAFLFSIEFPRHITQVMEG